MTTYDGRRAERCYSIASAPGEPFVELTVERVPDGRVSSYLVDDVREGDVLEVRGPVGEEFVWRPEWRRPLLVVAEGAGIVPVRAMLRHHRASHSSVPVRLLQVASAAPDLLYRREIMQYATSDEVDVNVAFTGAVPAGWNGYSRGVDARMLAEVAWPPAASPLIYVSGPTRFVDRVVPLLESAGHESGRIRREAFGGSAGSVIAGAGTPG